MEAKCPKIDENIGRRVVVFGYLRFFLAFLVLLSHIGVRFFTLNPGVVAVVIFYLLAGFVVSHIYTDILPDTKYKLLYFYKDRILRIFPLYLYVLLLSVIFVSVTSYGNPDFSFTKMLYNVTVIPLNYYMYLDSTILSNPPWCLIPPAWSLGTELQAYLLLSLLFVFKKITPFFVGVSIVIYIVSNFSLINPDYFGYRLLVGVFFIFFTGTLIQKISAKNAQGFEKYFPFFIWITVLFLVPIFYLSNSFSPTYTKETFLGLLVGIPLLFFMAQVRIKLPFNSLLGSLSYGVFLSHFFAIWILDFIAFPKHNFLLYVSALTTLSLLVAYIGVSTVEKKVKNIREFNSPIKKNKL